MQWLQQASRPLVQQAMNLIRDCINLCKILNLEVHFPRVCIVKLRILMQNFWY